MVIGLYINFNNGKLFLFADHTLMQELPFLYVKKYFDVYESIIFGDITLVRVGHRIIDVKGSVSLTILHKVSWFNPKWC